MSMIIEQDEQEWKQSLELNSNAEFQSIRLIGSSLSATLSIDDIEEDVQPLPVNITFTPVRHRVVKNVLTCESDFVFRVEDQDQKTVPLNVECRLEARYVLRPEFNPTEDQIRAFQSGNVIFNCWPFFREYVQNSVVRMSLPAPSVPFLRMMPKVVSEQNKLTRTNTPKKPTATRKPKKSA
jgi:hypothetical protein